MVDEAEIFDLLVIGGGINGSGIARDAAGRGLSVMLVEARDLAAATSSASSKLIHGGLRYLENYEFRLVRESLTEREILWAAAPHIIWPLRFVLPVHAGLRPPWLLRLGLFLYDHIGGRRRLPGTSTVRRGRDAVMTPLAPGLRQGFEYSDCWVDDARLVVANALDAHAHGASILVGWSVIAARRQGKSWFVTMRHDGGSQKTIEARALVNAAGPWVEDVLRASGGNRRHGVRLVKGSHIVVPRIHDGPEAYTLQNQDGRVVFIIPYQDRYSLIGTTDVPYDGDPAKVDASVDEIAYLCATASSYLQKPIHPSDVVWQYSGVRPLLDDGGENASKVTRDYTLDIDAPPGGAPLLSIFGGKITTFRRLAEHALADLLPLLGHKAKAWTKGAPLPGGDLGWPDFESFVAAKQGDFPALARPLIGRLCRLYGSRVDLILQHPLGTEILPGLFEAEARYLREHEWARSAEDILWRRTKLGLGLSREHSDKLTDWLARSA